MHGFAEGAAIAAANVTDDAIDVEENQGAGTQGPIAARLIG
jgi:hypothetical protein